ncbi:MAG: adenosylmethionine--8-amino-7-oxononanoate transaminase [Magnetococcus sp. WYHC-3]
MNGSSLRDLDRAHVWHPFTQAATAPDPLVIRQARGSRLETQDGRVLLDLISSWWVNVHGHAHPALAHAIARQAQTLEQVIFAGCTHEPAVRLAARLAGLLPGDLQRVFFSDNGSTAVEVALKMVLQAARNRGQLRRRIAACAGGYHGDTFGAMAAGRGSGFFSAFHPWLFDVDMLPFPATWHGDEQVLNREARALAVLDDYLATWGGDCAGLIVEPLIQGAGGMRMCRPEFLRALAQRLQACGVPLILDEVMTGFGRTGHLFACLAAGVTPDVICLSKGLTGGFLPLSVTVCRPWVYEAFLQDSFDFALAHGHSFTANPLGCAAALASLDLFDDPGVWEHIATIAALHAQRLQEVATLPGVRRPRQCGTVAALDLEAGREGYDSELAPALKSFFLERNLLLRPLGNTLYLLPPYCVTAEELHQGWDAVAEAARVFGGGRA